MKILKFLAILLVIVVLAGLVASLIGPKSYRVERFAIINANDSITHNLISKFQNWTKWSPWKEMDPGAHYSISGMDGTKGAAHTWEGKITGEGTMTWTEMSSMSMKYSLVFKAPWESESTGGFTLEDAGENKTKVSWYDSGDIPFSGRAYMLINPMEKMMGPQFERGLFKIDSIATIAQNSMAVAEPAAN